MQRSLNELHTRTGLTASYAIRWGDSAVVIENVEPDQMYRVSPRLGVQTPLAECAAGVAMLAQDGAAVGDAGPDLSDAIEQTRRRGYAHDHEAHQGVRSVAAAVGYGGQDSGALVVTGLSFNLNAEAIDVVGPLLAEQAGLLSATVQAMLPVQGQPGNVGIA